MTASPLQVIIVLALLVGTLWQIGKSFAVRDYTDSQLRRENATYSW